MEIRQLRYFVKIVDIGSMSRASGALFIAQPALSQQITALEEELGCKLLSRNARGVTVTASGSVLYRHAMRILRCLDELPPLVRKASDSPSGRVVIGIPVSVARVIAVHLVRAVAAAHPEIIIAFDEAPSIYLPERLLSGHLDLAIIFMDDLLKGIDAVPLFDEHLFLVEPARAGAANGLAESGLDALDGKALALTARPNSIRRLIDEACRAAGVEYTLVTEMSSPDRLLDLVREHVAATIMPWSGLGEAWKDPCLQVSRIASPRIRRRSALASSSDLGMTDAAKAVHTLVIQVAQELAVKAEWGAIVTDDGSR